MTESRYPPLILVDNDGVTWKEDHLRCKERALVPMINEHARSGLEWWWYCDVCQDFVRPLKKPELEIVNRVIGAALEERKQRNKKKRKTRHK